MNLKIFSSIIRESYYLLFLSALFVLYILLAIGCSLADELNHNTVRNCKVTKLYEHQNITGSQNNVSTSYRYLVVTDKETFVCRSSWWNGKYNNSDIFYRLEKDSVYDFYVSGFGKGYYYDYRNILEAKPVNKLK